MAAAIDAAPGIVSPPIVSGGGSVVPAWDRDDLIVDSCRDR